MQRKRAAQLDPKQKERYFISLYVKGGGTDGGIPYAERRACLKPGTGRIILQRKEVQDEISVRMEPVRLQQMYQQMVSDAVAQVTAKLRADRDRIQRELDTLMAVPDMNVDRELLEGSLMRLVLGLDWEKHPKVMLEAIKVAAVASGIMEIRSTGWLSPGKPALHLENGQTNSASSSPGS